MADNEGTTPARRSFRDVPAQSPAGAADAGEATASADDTAIIESQPDVDPAVDPTAGGTAEPAPPTRLTDAWYRKLWVRLVAGAVVVGAGVGITLAIVLGGGDESAAASPSPLASPTEEPSMSASPSAEPASLLDDGIAADEYPAAAPSRGDGYPEALVMEDWVWDKAGPGWAVVSVAPDAGASDPSPAVVYLASPEGVFFELVELPKDFLWASVATVIEDDHNVRLVAYDASARDSGGYLLHLDTAQIERMSFTLEGAPSERERFIASNAGNDELWLAFSAGHESSRYERWSRASGWQQADLGDDVGRWNPMSSPDGDTIAIEVVSQTTSGFASDRSGPDGEPNIVVYSLSQNSSTLVRPRYTGATGFCELAGVDNAGNVTLLCSSPDWRSQSIYAAANGVPLTAAPGDVNQQLLSQGAGSDSQTGIHVAGSKGEPVAHEVTVDGPGASVEVLQSGDSMSYDGIIVPVLRDAGGGLVVVTGQNACAVIDMQNSLAVLLGEVARGGAFGCAPLGVGNGSVSVPGWYPSD